MKNLLNNKIAMGLLASTISLSTALPTLAQTALTTPAVKPPAVVESGLPAVTFDATSFQQSQQLIDSFAKSYERLGKIVEILDKTKASVDQQKAVIVGQAPIQKSTNTKTSELIEIIENLTVQIEEQRKQTEESKKLLEKQLASVTGKSTVETTLGATDGGTSLYKMALEKGRDLPLDARAYYKPYVDVLKVDQAMALVDHAFPEAKILGDKVAKAVVTATLAEATYARAGESMTRLPGYLEDLAESETLKQSVDLNTRILLELMQQGNEQLRVLAANSFTTSHEIISAGAEIIATK